MTAPGKEKRRLSNKSFSRGSPLLAHGATPQQGAVPEAANPIQHSAPRNKSLSLRPKPKAGRKRARKTGSEEKPRSNKALAQKAGKSSETNSEEKEEQPRSQPTPPTTAEKPQKSRGKALREPRRSGGAEPTAPEKKPNSQAGAKPAEPKAQRRPLPLELARPSQGEAELPRGAGGGVRGVDKLLRGGSGQARARKSPKAHEGQVGLEEEELPPQARAAPGHQRPLAARPQGGPGGGQGLRLEQEGARARPGEASRGPPAEVRSIAEELPPASVRA